MSKLYDLLSAVCSKIKKPDWDQNDPTAADYVKNRPFYTKPGVELLPEITFNGSQIIDGSIGLEIGTQYTVMVNGIACPCVTRSMDLIVEDPITGTEKRCEIPELAFGNPVGNGFIYIADNYVDDYISFDTAGDYTEALIISIVSEDEVVKIPEKYLPTTIVTDEKLEKRLEGITDSGGNSGYVVQDTAPEDTSVLWVDPTDNSDDGFQEMVSAVIAALPRYNGEVEAV